MPFESLLVGAAACALMAGSAFAQTGGSMPGGSMPGGSMPPGSMPAGSMQQTPPTGESYGTSPATGGAMQNGMTSPATSEPGAATPTMGSFTPITPMPNSSIIATLQSSGEFTKLLAALQATNLTGLISTHPNLTLFAPTDAAFAALPPGQYDTLRKSPAQLQAILTYHLVAAAIKEGDIKGHAAGKIMTAAKKQITLDGSGATVMVEGTPVLQPAVTASNGFIYPIGKVLMPPAA